MQKKYWYPSKQLFADTEEKNVFSQHANTLAILTGLVTGQAASRIARQIQTEPGLAKASIYYKYYLHQALIKAGLGNDYLSWLDIWRENIRMGLTTWGETSDINITRSDCHAWGASPNVEFFRTVLGIDSDAPGFRRVKIEPHPGNLTQLAGQMPHPKGLVAVHYRLRNTGCSLTIDLPPGLPGYLVWKRRHYSLRAGKNEFKL